MAQQQQQSGRGVSAPATVALLVLGICGAAASVGAVAGASISVSPTLISDGDVVQVTWSSVAEEDRGDPSLDEFIAKDLLVFYPTIESTKGLNLRHSDGAWVGVYSPASTANFSAIAPQSYPATPPWTATAPIKWIDCHSSDGFAESGEGSFNFTMTNMREDVVFALFTGSTSSPVLLATSNILQFRNPYEPLQGHIALTGDPTEMLVQWNSKSAEGQAIKWGSISGRYSFRLNATSSTYSRSDLCGAPANGMGWRDPGFFNEALITGLRPGGSRIYYTFGSDVHGWSTERSFLTPKVPAPNESLFVAVIADMGETYVDGANYHWEEPDAVETIGQVTKLFRDRADVLVHVGDLSYATGIESEWNLFMSQIESMASAVPYMTGQGNHERDHPDTGIYYNSYDSGGECGVSTQARFHMPTEKKNATADQGWYSFDLGPAHFIMINTEFHCGPGSDQINWVTDDLRSVNRSVTPWVIFMGHRQMYSGNSRDSHLSDCYEDVMLQYKVDLVLYGHIHNTQQTCPLYRSKCIEETDEAGYAAPIHAVIGNAGQSLTPAPSSFPVWSEYFASEYGFSSIEISNATHLTMRFYADAPLDEDPPLHHELTIERGYPRV